MKKSIYFVTLLIGILLFSCSSDNDLPQREAEEVSPVVLDLEAIPYPKLSDYNLFKAPLSTLQPVYGVIPYEPISSLFSDYASKKRFIWMPENVSATYISDEASLNFPTGTILIKSFYYDHVLPSNTTKILETRLMIKKDDEWVFANYVWNEEQTEAYFDIKGSFVPLRWNQNGSVKEVNYRIPNGVECVTCHNSSEKPLPIATKPQNLNKTYNYSSGNQNQLQKLKDFGYLSDFPNQVQTMVDYHDTSQNLELRVRSYLDINCAHCHSDHGFCNYRSMRFQFDQTEQAENIGVCQTPDEDISIYIDGTPTHIVKPGNHEASVLYYRLNTTKENIRMPLRGRTLIHEEAVQMVSQWINSLEDNCE